MEQKAVVSIIGRTNVGKSTLFNTLLEKKHSITSKQAGTTRDRNYQEISWCGFSFYLVDTGGLDIKGKEEIEASVIKQAKLAIEQSDVIVLLVEAAVGITKEDRQAASYLKKVNKPVILAVNKVDNPKTRQKIRLADFLRLGLKNPILLSGINGSGTGDLLDEIVDALPKNLQEDETASPKIKLAVLGKPNVGKSSLVNAFLGEERVIVTNIPHTTRDPQNIVFNYQNQKLEIVDTAGVRKMTKINDRIEKESVNKTLRTIRQADVALMVLNITQDISHQDAHLASLIARGQKATVIVANQWDLIPGSKKKTEAEHQRYIASHLPHLAWAPVVFTSATKNGNINKCLNVALAAWGEYNKKIDTEVLTQFIKTAAQEHLPSRRKKSQFPKLKSLRQIKTAPPTFALKVEKKDSLHPSYLRFLEKRMRQMFGFRGSPISITLKSFKF
ncbi:MAG: ribosome biogenesis GTPase Der [Patescibacteria group bacterium]